MSFIQTYTHDLSFTWEQSIQHVMCFLWVIYSFSIWIIWYFGWCQSPLHLSAVGEHIEALKDTCWKLQSSCINSLQHLQKWEKENKTQGWAPAGGISLTGVESMLAKKPDSSFPSSQTESCQSFRTSLVLNKNFPSTLSTHFLYIYYST